MKEIKFRVWNGKKKEWEKYVEAYSPNFLKVCVSTNKGGVWLDRESEAMSIQQFTGLKDKNGREIFEDDIINYHPFNHVGYENKKTKVPAITSYHWFEELEQMMEWSDNLCEVEVIGNIHETPEKLEKG
jgi:uncharacterized phage protein (TIGR01671 family)